MRSEKKQAYDRRYFQEHKEELSAKNREYMQTHPEQRKKKVQRDLLRRKTLPEVAKRARECSSKWRQRNPDKVAEAQANWKYKIKVEVLSHYGNGGLACVSCGFSDIRALTLDHINNNGAEERRANKVVKSGGTWLYQWLRRQGYPGGYQTLCMNCQFIKEKVSRGLISNLKRSVGKP